MQRERRPWPPVLWEAALRKCVDPLAEGSRVTSTLDDGLRWCRQQPRTRPRTGASGRSTCRLVQTALAVRRSVTSPKRYSGYDPRGSALGG